MRNLIPGILAAPVLALALVGAGSAQAEASKRAARISYAGQVQAVFDHHCVACHRADGPSAGLVLERGLSYRQIMDVNATQAPMKLITPGNPQKSYLFRKMENTHLAAGGQGYLMPQFGGAAPAKDIEIVREWIAQGAREH